MLVLPQQAVDRDLWIEIQAQWPAPPAFLPDLELMGLQLRLSSRILRIESIHDCLSDQQVLCLYDPIIDRIIRCGTQFAQDYLAQDHPAADGKGIGTHDVVDVFCRPGVTDAEGEMAALALRTAGFFTTRCHAGMRYRFGSPVSDEVRPAVERVLGNSLIHSFHWHVAQDHPVAHDHPDQEVAEAPLIPTVAPPVVLVDLYDADCTGSSCDAELAEISRLHGLSLDTDEMRAVAAYFSDRGTAPTDVELQTIALAWSEHCGHKTFKARIEFEHNGTHSTISGLLHDCFVVPTQQLNRPWVRSAFVDNAGVIAFDETHDLALKVETHNHPSALEPYGGAHTGIGGVIRDILAVSAEPIANTNVLCFGPLDLPESKVPSGVFHPRRTFREVVRGIADYGNNMGIPTVGGAVLFHPGYIANPLVYCGTLGLAPRGSHPALDIPARMAQPGDLIVVLGGRTGRDGLHGATMSSATLDRKTVAASTVQIGAPITEKLLRDVLPRLRDARLYHAITDCGAGGLCSAVGEMGEMLGVDVELASVPLKYAGLRPWEIWLSEAQERIVLAVPPHLQAKVNEFCGDLDVEATAIGRFRGDGRLRLTFHGQRVADLDMRFVHDGRPQVTLQARWVDQALPRYQATHGRDFDRSLLALLAHPNIASKEAVIRRYDHEVGAATVIKPLVGHGGPSDGAVLQPLADEWTGAILAHGISPLTGEHDPYAMAMLAVDEALRNLVAVGGSIEHAALLDNFCWGEVDDPDALGSLVRAAQGCRDAALAYGVPFVSGKDSLRNTSRDQDGVRSIPGTLLITAMGVVPDVRRCITMDLKQPESRLYLLGSTADELGDSHYLSMLRIPAGKIPQATPINSAALMHRLSDAIQRGLVLSCHDLSEGGLAVAAAEMAIAGNRGLTLELGDTTATTTPLEVLLFSESAGRFLAEVSVNQVTDFEDLLGDVPCAAIGTTSIDHRFAVNYRGRQVIDLQVDNLDRAWKGTLAFSTGDPRNLPSNPMPVAEIPLPDQRDSDRRSATPSTPPRILVLAAAGTNCDRETWEACRLAGGAPELVQLKRVLGGELRLDDFSMLVLSGGFSYGDHLGAGAMLATMLRHRLLPQLQIMVDDGRPILGICNGFQTLCRLGLLGPVGLAASAGGHFDCRWVELQVYPSNCFFLDGLESIMLPIAHGEGRVVTPSGALETIERRAPLRYVENPNGSQAAIAGVCNEEGNVFGLMPHPERATRPQHYPGWRVPQDHPVAHDHPVNDPAGLTIFRNAVRRAGGRAG